MSDKITLERINLMHPVIREQLRAEYLAINNALPKGIRLRFAYTLRRDAEQDALYALGRTVKNTTGVTKSKPMGSTVTNAKGGQSIHNYGLAFDIVILYDLNGDGIYETASWDMLKDFDKNGEADWHTVVKFFKSKGWEWGGDWKSFKDSPHFQKTFGMTWREMQIKKQNGSTYKEVIGKDTYTWIKI